MFAGFEVFILLTSCIGGANVMTAYLENDVVNGSAPDSDLNYYSCPESQRNFTGRKRYRALLVSFADLSPSVHEPLYHAW